MAEYINLTLDKASLDCVQPGDLIKCNHWKRPLRVAGVSENFFLMGTRAFGNTVYSVCDKRPSAYTRNERRAGLPTIGVDFWLFGWFGGPDPGGPYAVTNPEWVNAYLKSWENGETEHSRSAIALHSIAVKKEQGHVKGTAEARS